MARTIRTCSLLALAALLAAAPAGAKRTNTEAARLNAFVGARAAAMSGDMRRSALLYASLAEAEPDNAVLANRAIVSAIDAGDLKLAMRLAERRPVASLPVSARLLLAADWLARGKEDRALAVLQAGNGGADLGFLAPMVEAWRWAERRDERALGWLARVPADSAVAPYLPEHRALILLRLRRPGEAQPLARQAIAAAGPRGARVRIALADGFMRVKDPARALAVLDGRGQALDLAGDAVKRGRAPGFGIDQPGEAFSELLLALALDLARGQARLQAIATAQAARHAWPANPQAPVLLGQLLAGEGRTDQALAVLRPAAENGLFASEARDVEIAALLRAERKQEALARAQAFVSNGGQAGDLARLGDVLSDMGRHGPAADAFGRALGLVQAGGFGPEPWLLHLSRGGELEQAERWAEAKRALEAAAALAPDSPPVLNYLGYAMLERGEELDRAEQLIARASRLAPDDASITDSLGWAQFKRGRLAEAIATLQRAAAADPAQAEIHEHLGDALYTAGRKFEARHAWNAALITAEGLVRPRIEAKIGAGLTPATAAP